MCPRVGRLTSPVLNAVQIEPQEAEYTGVERMAITHREAIRALAYARNRWVPKNDDGSPVNAYIVAKWTRRGLLTPAQQPENGLTSMSSPPSMARKPLPKIALAIQRLCLIKTTSELTPHQLDWDKKANCFYPDDIVTRAILKSGLAANLDSGILKTQVGMRRSFNAAELGDTGDTSEYGPLGSLWRDGRPRLWTNTAGGSHSSLTVYVAPGTAKANTIRDLFLELPSLSEGRGGPDRKNVSHKPRTPVGVEVPV